MVYIDIPEELYLRNKLAFGADSIVKKNGMFYINDGSVKVKVVDTFLNTEEIMSIEQSRIEKRRDLDKQGKYGIFNFTYHINLLQVTYIVYNMGNVSIHLNDVIRAHRKLDIDLERVDINCNDDEICKMGFDCYYHYSSGFYYKFKCLNMSGLSDNAKFIAISKNGEIGIMCDVSYKLVNDFRTKGVREVRSLVLKVFDKGEPADYLECLVFKGNILECEKAIDFINKYMG